MTSNLGYAVGADVHVSDEYYTGPAVVLEYDPKAVRRGVDGPYYCHLLKLCHHQGTAPLCDDPTDDCMGDWCRGWYAPEHMRPLDQVQ